MTVPSLRGFWDLLASFFRFFFSFSFFFFGGGVALIFWVFRLPFRVLLGHSQVGSHRSRSLNRGSIYVYRSLMEALYTLNSPPVVSLI